MAEQMKPSGIDWIGDVPNEWDITKVKYRTSQIGSGTTPDSGNPLYYEDGCFPWIQSGDLYNADYIRDTEKKITELAVADFNALTWYEKEFVVVAMYGASVGNIAISQISSYTNQACCVLKAKDDDLRYLFYFLSAGKENMLQMAFGGTQPNISQAIIKNLPYLDAPHNEQQAIADFLDKECAQIDSIAADLEKQIALLQQYKKSLITETVTKGLDKSVPMKDSGVEWASKIPCHWEIKRFKYLCEYITDGSHFSPETTDEGYPYITAADVKGVGLDYDAAKKISQQDFISLQKAGCQPRKSDVLLVKDGATTGRIGMVTSEKPCVVLSSVAILRAPDNMDARYLRYLMESDFVQAQIQASMAGSAMPRTVLSKIINYWGITCPKEEQKEICDFLDRKCGYIETVIETKQVQQSTIQQHKKSLIYEYVTGKKRVKEVQ